jgi:hypothetical protein
MAKRDMGDIADRVRADLRVLGESVGSDVPSFDPDRVPAIGLVPDQVDGDRRGQGRPALVAAVAVVCLVALATLALRSARSSVSTAGDQGDGLAVSTTTTSATTENPTPKLLLPPDQRRLWIAAYDSMIACMRDQGVTHLSDAPATVGDGQTPLPQIFDDGSPELQAAMAACPLDTSHMDRPVLAQAMAEATQELVDSLPEGTSDAERQQAEAQARAAAEAAATAHVQQEGG